MDKLVEFTERQGARVAINAHQVRFIQDNQDETCTIVFDDGQGLVVSAKYDVACSVLTTGLIST